MYLFSAAHLFSAVHFSFFADFFFFFFWGGGRGGGGAVEVYIVAVIHCKAPYGPNCELRAHLQEESNWGSVE